MTYVGIDYGSTDPRVNRNPETGVRYGIASARDLADWILDEAEPEYLKGCPACGSELPETFEAPAPCPVCGVDMDFGEEWGEEPVGWTLESDGVTGSLDESGDLWIFGSPVVTTGVHCSPCAPGAVSVGPEPVPDGPEAYGLPAEFWAKNED